MGLVLVGGTGSTRGPHLPLPSPSPLLGAVLTAAASLAEMKQITWLSTVGLLMVIFGDCLRKAAMLTAGSNFNHIVQNEKSDTHTLVTSGVYGWFRHPSYVGWFYWSIGTQVSYLTLSCFPLITCLFLHAAPALDAVETSGCQLSTFRPYTCNFF